MSREVRRVPADWEHPITDPSGGTPHEPLFDGFKRAQNVWDAEAAAWDRGEFPSYASEANRKLSFEEWDCQRPDSADYMPDWTTEERTHYQMYETTTEGTPISPVFETPEELARWLVDNGASAFGRDTAPYEQWLNIARGTPSMASCVMSTAGDFMTGVAAAMPRKGDGD